MRLILYGRAAAQSYSEHDYPSLSISDWEGYGFSPSEVTVSLGVQTFEKVLDGVCDLGRQSHGG